MSKFNKRKITKNTAILMVINSDKNISIKTSSTNSLILEDNKLTLSNSAGYGSFIFDWAAATRSYPTTFSNVMTATGPACLISVSSNGSVQIGNTIDISKTLKGTTSSVYIGDYSSPFEYGFFNSLSCSNAVISNLKVDKPSEIIYYATPSSGGNYSFSIPINYPLSDPGLYLMTFTFYYNSSSTMCPSFLVALYSGMPIQEFSYRYPNMTGSSSAVTVAYYDLNIFVVYGTRLMLTAYLTNTYLDGHVTANTATKQGTVKLQKIIGFNK